MIKAVPIVPASAPFRRRFQSSDPPVATLSWVVAATLWACLGLPYTCRGQIEADAYITNSGGSSVSVIDTTSNTVIGPPTQVGDGPTGVTTTPDGRFAYIANEPP